MDSTFAKVKLASYLPFENKDNFPNYLLASKKLAKWGHVEAEVDLNGIIRQRTNVFKIVTIVYGFLFAKMYKKVTNDQSFNLTAARCIWDLN